MPSFDERKTRELQAKIDGVAIELDAWRGLAQAQGPLEKHHTQMRRIGAVIDDALASLRDELRNAKTNGTILSRSPHLETKVLALHRVWAFFRDKLALRLVGHTRPFLRTADALAWSIVGPLLGARRDDDRFVRARRGEPPLVYLATPIAGSLANTPFALGREFNVARELAEFGDPHDDAITKIDARLRSAIDKVPVPLIGVPWYQLAFPGDLALVAHEAAHVAEFDLGLESVLDAAVDGALAAAGAPDPRRRLWHAWRVEVFADVVAAAALGPAYASALGAFLAAPKEQITAERACERSSYPPTTLRVALAAIAATPTGTPAADSDAERAAAIRDRWCAAFPPQYDGALDGDAAIVVTALLDTPLTALGGATIRSIVGLSAPQRRAAEEVARRVARGQRVDPQDVRVLVAGACLALCDSPSAFDDRARITALLGAADASIAAGVLSGRTSGAPSQAAADATRRADRARAAELLALFGEEAAADAAPGIG
ncbi:MAG TPA: hypothetical protein PKC43_12335 [Phycisphaerales bacterium]|nr:hypothetical protein [Phycisphaerales bacterium]HMP38221.1 hypothetical protein [Phycisphaerales bacterium]